MKMMQKAVAILTAVLMSLGFSGAMAGSWEVAGGGSLYGNTGSYGAPVRIATQITVKSLATRSGPSLQHSGCATLQNMEGRRAVALAKGVDDSGVCWVLIEVEYYPGAPRRCWVGAQRLTLSHQQLNRLPGDYFAPIGEGVITQTVDPRMGPGSQYVFNKDHRFGKGEQVTVVAAEGDFYVVERWISHPKTGESVILRGWVPASCVSLQ